MPELRQNVITRDWVIISTERQHRPDDFARHGPKAERAEHRDDCPFCPGNEDATEVDVDCIADVGLPNGGTIVIGGMLEHVEFAGVHSGDAAMVLPPHSLSQKVIGIIREYTHAMARELKVVGLMNVQYAVKGDTVYAMACRK